MFYQYAERWVNSIALSVPGGEKVHIAVHTAGLQQSTCGRLTTITRWSAEARLVPALAAHALLCTPKKGTCGRHTHRIEHPTFSIIIDAKIVGAHEACDEVAGELQHWAESLGALAELAAACDVKGDIPRTFEAACEALGIDLRWRLEQHRLATPAERR